jgi:hypothetical protein
LDLKVYFELLYSNLKISLTASMLFTEEEIRQDTSLHRESTIVEVAEYVNELSALQRTLLLKSILFTCFKRTSQKHLALKKTDFNNHELMEKVLKKRFLVRVMNQMTDEHGIYFDKAYLSNSSTFVIILSTLIWMWFILQFLSKHFEVILFGWDILIIPLGLILLGLPYLFYYFLFPDFIALSTIKGVKTVDDFIDMILRKNSSLFHTNNYQWIVQELYRIVTT